MEKKYLEARLKLKDDNRVSVIASSDTKDRDGEVIDPKGWELDRFKKNSVILWSHNPHLLPIGKATDAFVKDNQLILDVEFADHSFAKEVKALVKDGFINTTSVGFMPTEVDEKSGQMLKQELLEVSFVNVPSNPDATVMRQFDKKVKAFESKKFDLEKFVESAKKVAPRFEEKSGRVISEKNRNVIRLAKDALDEVLDLSESEPKKEEEKTPEPKKGAIEQPKTQGKKVNKTLRLAKMMDRVAEAIIHELKER